MEQLAAKIKSFAIKSRRVWKILKKPTKKEFQMVVKVSAIGIVILGFFGFLISVIMNSFV